MEVIMTNSNSSNLTNSKSRYCDFALYQKLIDELKRTGKKPSKMVQIINQLATETDFYQMNEFEMSLLTGEKLDALRNNRRPGAKRRWNFLKGETDTKAKISYPLKWVREQLEAPTH
tara:strand:+ start:3801 stop:4151 length:351 start_codon:yes stop_codon:yes gene_type:complete